MSASSRAGRVPATVWSAGLAALADALADFDCRRRPEVDRLIVDAIEAGGDDHVERRCEVLAQACTYYQRIGCSADGVAYGRAARDLAHRHGLKKLEHEACSVLSTAYLDGADYEEACKCLESALALARDLDDPLLILSTSAITGALFKEMGCYRDALAVIDSLLESAATTPEGLCLRFTAATTGLFCAHRLRDDETALRCLTIAAGTAGNSLIDAVARAAFEFTRTVYLIAHDDGETADTLLVAALDARPAIPNVRVDILLATATALCDWSSRMPERQLAARRNLRELHLRSRQMRLYHDDVLRALMQVCRRPALDETAGTGLAYAQELVDYTMRVKHAKLYRSALDRGGPVRAAAGNDLCDAAPGSDSAPLGFDPFIRVRRWLAADHVALPGSPGDSDRSELAHDICKHDELTAIHDDLATMRTAALKASIRTAPYAMAENWALAAEFFDDETGQHCFRVGRLAGLLAAELGLDAEYCLRIEHAARLHDIGKITVNEMVLRKPGPLDPDELAAMRAHAEVGGFLLRYADDPTLRMASVIARHHHEWWNGTGYPHNLAGERIPLEARICALADVYDALTSARPYKRAWPHLTSVQQMLGESGVHFDPRLMTPFLRVLEHYVVSDVPVSLPMPLTDRITNSLLVSTEADLDATG